jgi:hypothetical protein
MICWRWTTMPETSYATASINYARFAASSDHWRSKLNVLSLLRSMQVGWITATLFYMVLLRRQHTGFNSVWTLQHGSLSELASTAISLQSWGTLFSLHRLPVEQRIIFKVATLAFDCVRMTRPAYFSGTCTLLAETSRRSLRSAQRGEWRYGASYKENCSRSSQFPCRRTGHLELFMPSHLHSTTPTRQQFRSGLKTHLFQLAYHLQELLEGGKESSSSNHEKNSLIIINEFFSW